MPFATRDVRSALTGKLKFSEDRSGSHPVFVRWHAGRIVGKTHISHGKGRDVSDKILGKMAQQLHVRSPDFRAAIDCRMSSESFLEAMIKGTR